MRIIKNFFAFGRLYQSLLLNLMIFIAVDSQENAYLINNVSTQANGNDKIDITWSNPNNSFDYILLNYNITDDSTFNSIKLLSNETSYQIANLKSGSTVLFILKTFTNNLNIASTSYYSATTKPDNANITNITSGIDYISVKFSIPNGYYDKITFYCSNDANEEYGEQDVPKGIDTATCSVFSGLEYKISLTVFKSIVSSEGSFLTAKTKLSDPSLRVSEPSSGVIRMEWDVPDAYFDSILITLTLESTDSNEFFRNNTINRTECKLGFKEYYTGLETDEDKSFTYSNACPLSKYNFIIQTIKANYDPSQGFKTLLQTKYQNIDCSTVSLITIGNLTTFKWAQPEMKVRTYLITVQNSTFNYSTVLKKDVETIDIYGLGNNQKYTFEIQVTNKKYKSEKCEKIITTDPPCPEFNIDKPISKYIAPYPEVAYLFIDSASINYNTYIIDNISIIVGIGKNCFDNPGPNCYTAEIYNSYDSFIADIMNRTYSETFQLSRETNCGNKSICNIKFEYDKDYYVGVEGVSKCGIFKSNTIIINIPSPFPIGSSIAIAIGVVSFILITILTIILVITYKQIKKKHEEDLAFLIANESEDYKKNNQITNASYTNDIVTSKI